MEITEAYRKSRRNLAITCGLAIAWSASQFELDIMSLGLSSKVKVPSESIPIILSGLIIYLLFRCALEYTMQKVEVRRWQLAKLDFKVILNLGRFSILSLGASAVVRSIDTIFWLLIAAVSLFVGYFILVAALMFLLMPIRIYLNSRQGRTSVASAAFEAMAWSMFFSGIIYISLIFFFGFGGWQPFEYLNNTPEDLDKQAMIIFYVLSGAITFSFFFESKVTQKIFAFEPLYTETEISFPDGSMGIKIGPNPKHPDYENPVGFKPRN